MPELTCRRQRSCRFYRNGRLDRVGRGIDTTVRRSGAPPLRRKRVNLLHRSLVSLYSTLIREGNQTRLPLH